MVLRHGASLLSRSSAAATMGGRSWFASVAAYGPEYTHNVMFLCNHNSCRSQMADGMLQEIRKGYATSPTHPTPPPPRHLPYLALTPALAPAGPPSPSTVVHPLLAALRSFPDLSVGVASAGIEAGTGVKEGAAVRTLHVLLQVVVLL